jgi:septal ring factor EnvC (AmiA/AmiB activator)
VGSGTSWTELPATLEAPTQARADRVERRLGRVLRHLEARLSELDQLRAALAISRREAGLLQTSLGTAEQANADLRQRCSDLDRENRALAERCRDRSAAYDSLLATKSMRMLAMPRRIYGHVLQSTGRRRPPE